MAVITLTLPYPPSANRLWRIWRGRQILSAEARQYKSTVALLARMVCETPLPYESLVSMTVRVYRPRKAGDLGNRIKILQDALNKVAYNDDEQIIEEHHYRCDDKANPRVEVIIEVIDTRPSKKTRTRKKKALVTA
jgi:crossover junction endodeoxyribonuclease RusA